MLLNSKTQMWKSKLKEDFYRVSNLNFGFIVCFWRGG